jgi:hypothetical protein
MPTDEQQADDQVADGKNLAACGAWAGPLARKSLNHGAVLKLNMPLVEIARTASGYMPVVPKEGSWRIRWHTLAVVQG